MKGSLIILGCFILGMVSGRYELLPEALHNSDVTIYVLCTLLLLIGINIGYDKSILSTLRRSKPKILLVPLATIVGTLLGTALVSLLFDKFSAFDMMAVGSGFGYYSLSSIFITEYKGAELGTIALASNIIRELSTLLIAPVLAVYFGKLAPIAAGGATTLDTTLPIVTQVSGSAFVFIAIFHGLTLDLCVPFLVTFLCQF